jgi:hypothetical protein
MGRSRKHKSSVSVQVSCPESAVKAQAVRILSIARQNSQVCSTTGAVVRNCKALTNLSHTHTPAKITDPLPPCEPSEPTYMESEDVGMDGCDPTDGVEETPAVPKVR